MVELLKALALQEGVAYDGAFIAKVIYQRFPAEGAADRYRNKIVKSSSRLSVTQCSGFAGEALRETLTVYILFGAKVKEPETAREQRGELWRSFSKGEIAAFSRRTGDTNSIHLTGCPVVQGLFLLKELCGLVQPEEIEIKFVHPVYGDTPVYLEQLENHLRGFSGGALCFEAVFKKAGAR